MTPKRLEQSVAIVTGGSSGIGRATSVALAREGARVTVLGRNADRLEATLAEMKAQPGVNPADCIPLQADVRSEGDAERMARSTRDRFGRIDILVAAAGVSLGTSSTLQGRRPVADLPVEAWDEIVDTNLKGLFLTNRAVLPAMISQRGGDIVNVASTLGKHYAMPFASAYCASKFGVMGLTEALAEEVRGYGVRVQAIVPDAVDTPMLQHSGAALVTALGPENVADLIVELLAAPEDAVFVDQLIEPFSTGPRPRRRMVL